MKIIIIIIIKNEKKNLCRKNGICLLPKLYCNTTIALQAAGQAGAHRHGRWARRALGAQGVGRPGQAGTGRRASGRWVSGRRVLGRVTRRRAAGRRTCGVRGRGTRGARHERQAGGRASGDTAEGLLRHGASARSARGHARCHTLTFCSCAAPRNPLGQPSQCLIILSNTRAYGALPNSYFISY